MSVEIDNDTDLNINQTATAEEVAEVAKALGQEPAKGTEEVDGGAKAGGTEDHDDDDHEEDATAKVDTELAAAQNEEEREKIRVRRREERRTRKERAREKFETLERTVAGLNQQLQAAHQTLASLQTANAGAQAAQIDGAIASYAEQAARAKAVLEDAVTKGDGALAAKAMEAMNDATARSTQLSLVKQQMARSANQPKAADPMVLAHGTAFMNKHKWYGGPQSNDPDSRVMSALDTAVANDGFDPRTTVYWEELESRAKKYLAHRFTEGEKSTTVANNGNQRQTTVKSPVAGSGNGASSGGGGKQFQLSAERVKAMKEAGSWDDPKRREAQIRRFQEFDKANS